MESKHIQENGAKCYKRQKYEKAYTKYNSKFKEKEK